MGISKVACASFDIGTNTTITITADSKDYTHTLKYSFNGVSGTIVEKTNQTSYVWTPPTDAFYSSIPNMTSGYGTITCETYNGSSLVGASTCGFYAYTVRSQCEPEVSGTVVDDNAQTVALTGDSSAIVMYLSKPKCTIEATAKNSATIKSIQIENPVGLVATTSPFTFDTNYSNEFRFKATDSRGYSKVETVMVDKFIEYSPCHFDSVPKVTREGTTVSGYCFNGSFGKASNELSLKYRYKTSDDKYGEYTSVAPTWNVDGKFTANITIPNLDIEETYIFEFVVSDKLTSFPVETVLGQNVGDLRIAKTYVQTKNDIHVGSDMNEEFRGLRAKRKINDTKFMSVFGINDSDSQGTASIELYKNGERKGRIEVREDGYAYNHLTAHSLAEIVSSTENDEGHLYLDGGGFKPLLLQWGKVSVVPALADTIECQNIKFLKKFGTKPTVFCEVANAPTVEIKVRPSLATNEGFRINVRRGNIASTTVCWMAIGRSGE